MREAIQCSICCETGGHRLRQVVVKESARGHNGFIHDQFLLPRVHIGDIGVFGEMRPRTGRSLDGDKRGELLAGLL